jgi:hypothetical protein
MTMATRLLWSESDAAKGKLVVWDAPSQTSKVLRDYMRGILQLSLRLSSRACSTP